MRCQHCGTNNAPKAKFCQECGKNAAAAPAPFEGAFEQITVSHRRPQWVADDPNMNTQIRKKIEMAQEGLSGTRRFVTILFADIQGFTSLCERMDPEQVTELMNRYLGRLGKVVYEFEGYVDKYIGDCIMALFGAPIAHDNDPELAIRTAVKMIQTLGELNAETSNKLAIRIGINAGMVVAGGVGNSLKLEFTVMGDAVNVAQRLQSAAQPGQIVVGQSVARATRALFDFEPLTLTQVKGKSDPVEAFVVRGMKGARQSQTRGLTETQTKLIGRKDVLQSLRPLLRTIKAERSQHFALSGPAGIGKSRLKWELRSALKAQGVEWLEASCSSLKSSIPLSPFRDLLGSLARESKEAQRLLQQMESATFENHEKKLSIFLSIKTFLQQRAKAKYTVYFIDDLQWLDPMSIEALLYVGAQSAHFIFAGAGRSVDRGLLKAMNDVPLMPLTDVESVELLSALLKTQKVPNALRDFIVTQCQGNPLFIEETTRSLVEKKTLVLQPSGEWQLAGPLSSAMVSEGLQSLVLARIDQLPMADRDVLEVAAVMGRRFSYKVLRTLLSGHPHLDESIQFLRQRELIFEFEVSEGEIEYIFNQNITREIAYQSILRKRQRDLHQNVAEALETLLRRNDVKRSAEVFETLAHHYRQADNLDRWAHYLLASTEYKTLQSATEQLTEALKLKLSPSARDLLVLKLVDLYYKRGSFDEAQKLIIESLASVGASARPQLLVRAAEVEFKRQALDVAESYLADLEGWAHDPTLQTRALKIMANLKGAGADPSAALGYFERAVTLGAKSSDSLLVAEVLNDLSVTQINLKKFVDAKTSLQKALQLATGPRAHALRAKLLINQGAVLVCLGEAAEALTLFVKASEAAEAEGLLFDQMKALHNAAIVALQVHEVANAKKWFEQSRWLADQLSSSQQRDLNDLYITYLRERETGVAEVDARAKLELTRSKLLRG